MHPMTRTRHPEEDVIGRFDLGARRRIPKSIFLREVPVIWEVLRYGQYPCSQRSCAYPVSHRVEACPEAEACRAVLVCSVVFGSAISQLVLFTSACKASRVSSSVE